MIVKPSVAELLKKSKNRFELVIATSKRARKIASGAEPLVVSQEEAPVTIAAEEIAAGKVIISDEEPVTEESTEGTVESMEEDNK